MKPKILTPRSKDWPLFRNRLRRACHFETHPEKPPGKRYTWKCSAQWKRPLATKILKRFPKYDTDATLEFFRKHGGHCDCEIVFNVEDTFLNALKTCSRILGYDL